MKIEEIAEGVFALSTFVPVGNRSWLPDGAKGFEPFTVYLALSETDALLIDTGPRAHRESLLAALDKMVGSRRLTVMVTRSELDCISNIGAVLERFPVFRVLGTMKNLPILGLFHFERGNREISADRIVIGQPLVEYGFGRLRPFEPVIKTLSTIWLRDEQDEVLLTSDFFSADLCEKEGEAVRREEEGTPSQDYIRKHVLAKFDWLARADSTKIAAAWDRMFSTVRPRVIAPGLGRIQSGAALAARVVQDYRAALFGDQSVSRFG